MVNYQLAKIYKLVDNTNGNIYIGSTCKPYLSSRLVQHKLDYQRYIKGTYHYVTSFDILKNGDYDIILLESYPCDDKMQIRAKERYFIESLKCVNKHHPTKTQKEHYEENKDMRRAKQREYKNQNREKINEK